METFTDQLENLFKESKEIQKEEAILQTKARVFNDKLLGFLKSNGLPDNFTLPELAMLAVQKSRSGIIVSPKDLR